MKCESTKIKSNTLLCKLGVYIKYINSIHGLSHSNWTFSFFLR